MFLYVRLPPFSYAKYFLFPASRVLSRNDPHPGRQISSFSKGASVANRSDQGCRGDRTDSWNLREPLAVFILFRRFLNDSIYWLNARCELLQFQFELSQQNTE